MQSTMLLQNRCSSRKSFIRWRRSLSWNQRFPPPPTPTPSTSSTSPSSPTSSSPTLHSTWYHPTKSINQRRPLLSSSSRRIHNHCGGIQLPSYPSFTTTASSSPQPQIKRRTAITTYLTNLTPRTEANLEDRILGSLRSVQDPLLNLDIGSLGWVTSLGFPRSSRSSGSGYGTDEEKEDDVVVTLQFPTLPHPSLQELKKAIVDLIKREIASVVLEQMSSSLSSSSSINHTFTNDDKREETLVLFEKEVVIRLRVETKPPVPFVRLVEEEEDVLEGLGPGLANVGHFVAVYSCKGGVGKSTVAINLAYELARMGGRIGIVDVDVYGPSLPVLVKPTDPTVRRSSLGTGMVKPIEHKGVKMLSLGFVSPDSGVPGSGQAGGAAVMRGPMAGRVVTQLLKGTDWGELDVLILDMPPGTGDVQLTLCQDLQLSGAVSVTTPSKLAATDAQKGVEMFTSMGVPTLAVVENMAYFECEGGGRHYPFGKKSPTSNLCDSLGLTSSSDVFQLPISPHANEANEAGSPLCLGRPSSASVELSIFAGLAKTVAGELLKMKHAKGKTKRGGSADAVVRLGDVEYRVADLYLSVVKTEEEGEEEAKEMFAVRLFSDMGAMETRVEGEKLRNWHPELGEEMEPDQSNSGGDAKDVGGLRSVVHVETTSGGGGGESGCGHDHDHSHSHSRRRSPTLADFKSSKRSRLFPCKVEKKGRYGYSVEWADGATIIYSMFSLAKAAGGILVKASSRVGDDVDEH